MIACPACGRDNPADARFCNSCGAALEVPAPREVRKIVTVLFADVVGSTALGEATDREALRTKMRSYFEDLRRIVECHGGTVEKFVGDAVMAVFGIPVAPDTTDHFFEPANARLHLAMTLRRVGQDAEAAALATEGLRSSRRRAT